MAYQYLNQGSANSYDGINLTSPTDFQNELNNFLVNSVGWVVASGNPTASSFPNVFTLQSPNTYGGENIYAQFRVDATTLKLDGLYQNSVPTNRTTQTINWAASQLWVTADGDGFAYFVYDFDQHPLEIESAQWLKSTVFQDVNGNRIYGDDWVVVRGYSLYNSDADQNDTFDVDDARMARHPYSSSDRWVTANMMIFPPLVRSNTTNNRARGRLNTVSKNHPVTGSPILYDYGYHWRDKSNNISATPATWFGNFNYFKGGVDYTPEFVLTTIGSESWLTVGTSNNRKVALQVAG